MYFLYLWSFVNDILNEGVLGYSHCYFLVLWRSQVETQTLHSPNSWVSENMLCLDSLWPSPKPQYIEDSQLPSEFSHKLRFSLPVGKTCLYTWLLIFFPVVALKLLRIDWESDNMFLWVRILRSNSIGVASDILPMTYNLRKITAVRFSHYHHQKIINESLPKLASSLNTE